MKTAIRSFLMAGALCVGGAALANDSSNMKTMDTAKTPAMDATATTPKWTDVEFAQRLHHINQHEIKAGELALTKTTSPDVKKFAQMMVDDHTKADKQLTDLAHQNSWALTDPKPKDDGEMKAHAANKADMEHLKVAHAATFDSMYMAAMVAGHDGAIWKIQTELRQNPNSKLQPLLTQILPTIKSHRTEAYKILGRTGDQMGVGGSGSGSMMDPQP